LASLAELCGAKAPKNDGTSYAKELVGGRGAARDYLYFEYPEATSQRAIVFGRMKAIQPNLKKQPELIEIYDLQSDPSEAHDLSATEPDLVARAKRIFAREHVPNNNFPLPGVDPVKK
jgi:arylsulfatase A-like enzyme